MPKNLELMHKASIRWVRTDSDREKLRICWTAWWTDPSKKTPETATLTTAKEMKPLLADAARWGEPAHRFLNAQLLQDGDKLIPLLYGQKDCNRRSVI